ncbi:hypothetical protein [Chryseobacterium sp.]|uniref:hypothetical protein n=1 Tax=Chryseobacterium sp. TaxID=1871047 RepID=UPI0011C7BAD0|nr:hypothetical protein [Chryseobacterium sp.]TXF79555.1 hypothetical protein FUA25_04005 [Chryseobacterium sp.]
MLLNLFTRKKVSFVFSENDWEYDAARNNYCLTISTGNARVGRASKICLYKLQGEIYVFMSEGFETIKDNLIIYFAQFPFNGKIAIK